MKLLFKQRLFSWFDSYDIYDEAGNTVFVVKGELAWGHLLRIYNSCGKEVISKEFTFIRPRFNIDYNGWNIDGDWLEWDYNIRDCTGRYIACVSKEIWNWTDTYVLDVQDPQDALYVLMLVLAIDAEKCSRND